MAQNKNPYRYGSNAQDVILTDSQAVPIADTTGSQIDPATEQTLDALAAALASDATDSLLVDSNTPLDASAAEVDVDLNSQTLGSLSTDIAAALASNATDTLQTEQQTPVGVEDSTGTQVDPATETTLSAVAGALASNGTDTLQTEQQTPVSIEDASGTQVNPKGADEVYANGAALAANGTNTYSVSALGGRSINGKIRSSGSYDVVVRWQNSAGTTIATESIASAVTGGSWTDVNLNPKSAHATIAITDTSSASQTVDATLHFN